MFREDQDPILAVEKLKKQNEKLRTELRTLTKALDDAVERQRKEERKRARAPIHREEENSEVEKELQQALGKINKYKQDIASMKKQLDGNLNEPRITELENQSRYLNKRIKELETENMSLQKIEREQKKAIDQVQNAQNYPQKMKALKDETRQLKDEYRQLLQQQKQDEKILKEQHGKCVALEEKCRKLKALINQRKQQQKQPQQPEVTDEDLQELKIKVEEVEQKKKEEELRLKARIKEIEAQIKDSRNNIEELNIKLKEKEQECRISVLRINELKRLVRHNQLKPLPRPPKQEENTASIRKAPVVKSKAQVIRKKQPAQQIKQEQNVRVKPQKEEINVDQDFEPSQEVESIEDQLSEPSNSSATNNEEPSVFAKPNFKIRQLNVQIILTQIQNV